MCQVLVGGVIAIASAVLTALLNNCFQRRSMRDRQRFEIQQNNSETVKATYLELRRAVRALESRNEQHVERHGYGLGEAWSDSTGNLEFPDPHWPLIEHLYEEINLIGTTGLRAAFRDYIDSIYAEIWGWKAVGRRATEIGSRDQLEERLRYELRNAIGLE